MAALKDRRARVAGEIYELKRQIGKRKQILAHLDETRRPTSTFGCSDKAELQRLVPDALRGSGQPLACHEVAEVISRKFGGEPHPSMTQQVRCNLVYPKQHKGVGCEDWRGPRGTVDAGDLALAGHF